MLQSRIGRRKDAAAWLSIGRRVGNTPKSMDMIIGVIISRETWNGKMGEWVRIILNSA